MQLREFLLERYHARYEFSTPFQRSASDGAAPTIGEVLRLESVPEDEFLGLALGYPAGGIPSGGR